MHKLNRGPAPTCLASYTHGHNTWGDVSSEDKQLIWTALETMQGLRCAYCEAALERGKRHIEHFDQKSRQPALTFHWSNLFGSCLRKSTCGVHKDRIPAYNPADLIKPDIEDPDDFFVFTMEGSIGIRRDIPAPARHRASETLRIFNLDADRGPLRRMRSDAARGYVQTAEYLAALAAEYPEEDVSLLLEEELERIADLPFATVIRHVLSRRS